MLKVFARFKSRKEENGIPKDSQKGAQPKEIKSKNFNLNCLEMNLYPVSGYSSKSENYESKL